MYLFSYFQLKRKKRSRSSNCNLVQTRVNEILFVVTILIRQHYFPTYDIIILCMATVDFFESWIVVDSTSPNISMIRRRVFWKRRTPWCPSRMVWDSLVEFSLSIDPTHCLVCCASTGPIQACRSVHLSSVLISLVYFLG